MRVKNWNALAALALAASLSPCAAPRAAAAQQPGATGQPDSVVSLFQRALSLEQSGQTAEAVKLTERALALIEQAGGADSLPAAMALDFLALEHLKLADYARARSEGERALSIRERAQGAEHADLAMTLTNLARACAELGDGERAVALYRRALDIQTKASGADSPAVATTLYSLAAYYNRVGSYREAEGLLRRALDIQERKLGADHFFVALTLNNLAFIDEERGSYDESERFYLRALSIVEKQAGADDPIVATALTNLAALYRAKGDYVRAEPLLRRALDIQERKLGADHVDVSITLNSLALLYMERGDYDRAEPLLRRALSIRERALGADSSEAASVLSNLAYLHDQRNDPQEAVALYERALAVEEKTLGADHALVATTLNNLATALGEQGEYDRAESLLRRALAITEASLGADHPDAAIILNALGRLAYLRGDAKGEESLYTRALAISEKSLGENHPQVANLLNNLATTYWAEGSTARALDAMARAAEIRERNLATVLTVGSEQQKRLYMATLAAETDAVIAFHTTAAPADRQAAALALTTVLRRKGRVLDAVADQIAALRRRLDPEDQRLLDRLAAARAELARLTIRADETDANAAARRADRARLETEIDRLEQDVSARSAAFRAASQPVTIERVRAALPAGAALVEFAVFRPFRNRARTSAERWGAPRYVAYVLDSSGDVRWTDLGEAAGVERAVAAMRAALVKPGTDPKPAARALDELVMRPVRKLLGERRTVFVSPDGALNLVPFAALVDEQGKYLVETYSLTYLTSGRDLLRLQVSAPPRGGAIVFADPAFDDAAAQPGAGAAATQASAAATQEGVTATQQATAAQSSALATVARSAAQGRRSADLASAHFSRLPGTAAEARALGSILPAARVLTGAEATEAALKRVAAPAVLHVATHGFFLPDEKQSAAADASRGLALGGAPAAVRGENPLLRSGLALAGANLQRDGAGEDGILTAYEAAGLDLWGTRLVVLSACETGVGEVANGEGVYGLRRALVLAGSESQVMSLWQVSDEATRDLMIAYYRRLQAGAGRSEALRRVQLEMIAGGTARGAGAAQQRGLGAELGGGARDRSHPFYWAAFIQ
ncbi:MAG: tetratricopeptide repeat protein, partial [Acidobacteria bacterium]|nr:tetratricopeptide repeat protein [Acidobacteriota bacterium]